MTIVLIGCDEPVHPNRSDLENQLSQLNAVAETAHARRLEGVLSEPDFNATVGPLTGLRTVLNSRLRELPTSTPVPTPPSR